MIYPNNGSSPADAHAAKRQRYEEALERAVGFEPGESKLSDDEILARRAARLQAAEQADRPQPQVYAQSGHGVPLQAILNALQARPGMFEHLEGVDVDGDSVADFHPGPPPMDPRGRMQWQSMMAQRQQMAQARQQRRFQRKEGHNRFMLGFLQAHDPLFGLVHRKITEFVGHLSPKLQRFYLRAVEETPGAYLDLYQEMRDLLVPALGQGANRGGQFSKHVQAVPIERATPLDPREAVRRVVAGRMDPNRLQNAGVSEDRVPGASRAAELAALKTRCRAGQAREGDLLRYIELMMPEGNDE